MATEPAATAVTSPLVLTLAMLELLDVHVTVVGTPDGALTAALICNVSFTCSVIPSGPTLTVMFGVMVTSSPHAATVASTAPVQSNERRYFLMNSPSEFDLPGWSAPTGWNNPPNYSLELLFRAHSHIQGAPRVRPACA
jgi:hypothetical protein